MNKKPNRRKFIKSFSIGGLAASIDPTNLLDQEQARSIENEKLAIENAIPARKYNGSYTGEFLSRVAFPIGGIGAGMFCIEGSGAISHMSIRNKPEVFNEPGLFAALHVKGLKNGTKILEGPVPAWKKFGQPGSGNGLGGAITGLPHFQYAEFEPRFPFATIKLKDPDIPMSITIEAWSPFIPTDEDNSSLPVGGLEYHFINNGKANIDAVFSYNAKNFLAAEGGKSSIQKYPGGFMLTEEGSAEKKHLKSKFAIWCNQEQAVVDHSWFRGGWWDPLTMAWNNIRSGEIKPVDPVDSGAPGASLFIPFHLSPGQSKTLRIKFCWFTPDSDQKHGKISEVSEACDPASGCCSTPALINLEKTVDANNSANYKPWYSERFKTVLAVTEYWNSNYDKLKSNSRLFTTAFYSGTLPPEVMEAIAANLTILKSPTVLRQYDGRLWNFEGCGDNWGCCHGSCTHVWNYAQAIPHLFPTLERSLRHTEFCENQNMDGHQNFRATLPIKPVDHGFHPAADGQLGGIMKVHREWRISGDTTWLQKMYPMVKVSIDYCIRTWDPYEKGIIEEPHHNTYDIEFWGPDGMHATFYLGALRAMIVMGTALGKDVQRYQEIFAKGKKYTETELFDGEYFIQKIQYTGLKAKDPVEASAISINAGTYSEEAKKLLEKEGPKYQYGTGCLSDGVLGAWIARMCGLDDPIDEIKIQSHLKAVHKYNLKDSLSDHANPQRPAYALGDEAGLLLCSWPKGGKLSLPFVYSDEVWTGIEHQVAAHLMLLGNVKEGLEIVRASRNRYDGRIRNPFNEYECGHWYARALSSYGYIQALTGLRYDAVDKTLFVDSKIGDFTAFLSTATGFGTVSYKKGKITVDVAYGKIEVTHFSITGKRMAANP